MCTDALAFPGNTVLMQMRKPPWNEEAQNFALR